MNSESVKIALKDVQVVDGKVVVDSEELLQAYEDFTVDPIAAEEDEAFVLIGLGCKVG